MIFLVVMVALFQACIPSASLTGESMPTPVMPQGASAPSAVGSSRRPSITPLDLTRTQPLPTIANRATPTPSRSTSTPTIAPCLLVGGQVEVAELSTELLSDPLVYRIYLPPCYLSQPERLYPVLYLVHGQTYTDTQWQRLGVPGAIDRLVAAREIAPFIVVMPRDRLWREPTSDNFGMAIQQALIPWVDGHYRTNPERAFRAIGGLSRGAAWAIHLGFSHPELFSAVGIHSGFVFYTDVGSLPQWLSGMPEGLAPRIYIDAADNDRPEITESSTWLEEVLTQNDIPHEWHMFTGEHAEAYWQAHVEDYLRWYSLDWAK
ncbi:MAG: hypothetical protein A2136_08965 [Chloroflexi bacterium RBG_16_54_11]|nr:MAG: hypothetical protein A2136_08965 [Chloroflexi bacterium RBG_16_54_11]